MIIHQTTAAAWSLVCFFYSHITLLTILLQIIKYDYDSDHNHYLDMSHTQPQSPTISHHLHPHCHIHLCSHCHSPFQSPPSVGDMIYFKVLGQHFLILCSLEQTTDLSEKRSSNYSTTMKEAQDASAYQASGYVFFFHNTLLTILIQIIKYNCNCNHNLDMSHTATITNHLTPEQEPQQWGMHHYQYQCQLLDKWGAWDVSASWALVFFLFLFLFLFISSTNDFFKWTKYINRFDMTTSISTFNHHHHLDASQATSIN